MSPTASIAKRRGVTLITSSSPKEDTFEIGTSPLSIIKNALNANPGDQWDPDRLLDAIHWLRQILSVVCGLVWGSVPLVGMQYAVGFLAVNVLGMVAFYQLHLKIDPEDFGGHGVLQQEGFVASVALFLLVWIITYSFLHF
mmetsp:Transcript_35676/g.49531  ORF Transcript_35676/g.49531 Transcript_35676/m.49531 type:complete len:141 (+) Transcript_35676:219-641(+)